MAVNLESVADVPKPHTVTDRQDCLEKYPALFAKIFNSDAGFRFVTSSLSQTEHAAYLASYLGALCAASRLSGAVFQEIDNSSCIAIWFPPGKSLSNPITMVRAGILGIFWKLGYRGIKRILWDWERRLEQIRHDALTARNVRFQDTWYLFLLGTIEDQRRKGYAHSMMRSWQEGVSRERPIVLETTCEAAKAFYEGCGFEAIDRMTLGEGSHNSSGEEESGGKGFVLFLMLWTPK